MGLDSLNIQKLYMDGYEADDVIGTLAKKAEQEDFQVYMMTSDKDFAQLVSGYLVRRKHWNNLSKTSVTNCVAYSGCPDIILIQRRHQYLAFGRAVNSIQDS